MLSGCQDPWDLRDWTLQEKLLSSRLIPYSSFEMQWTCKTLSTCECKSPRGADWNECPSSIYQVMSDHQAYMFWHVHVWHYSKRHLTDPSDKLPAISGLASKIHKVTGSEYFAGLWMGHFIKDLCWERSPQGENTKNKAPLLCRAPTFSWASIDEAIYYDEECYYGGWTYYTKVLDKSYKLLGTNRFGHVANCTLELRGPFFEASLSSKKNSEYTVEYSLTLNGTIEDFFADALLEDFTFEDSLGSHKRSIRRSAKDVTPPLEIEQVSVLYLGSCSHTTSSSPLSSLSASPTHSSSPLQGLGDIDDGIEIEKCRGKSPWHYFLVLGRSPRDFDAYERLGIIMVAEGWPELYEKASSRTVSLR